MRNLTLLMLFKKVSVSIFVIILAQYFANLEFVHICLDKKTQISRRLMICTSLTLKVKVLEAADRKVNCILTFDLNINGGTS